MPSNSATMTIGRARSGEGAGACDATIAVRPNRNAAASRSRGRDMARIVRREKRLSPALARKRENLKNRVSLLNALPH